MRHAAARRVLGLMGGVALIALGASEIVISRSNFESPQIQTFCRAGFCAEQFSPARVFEISQKAILGDPQGELEDFRRALRLSPASAYRWADFGEAEFNVRDYRQADYAFSQALKAGPKSPVILMRAANIQFQIGNEEAVIHNLAAILNDPELADYYDTAFLTYSRLGLPVYRLLREGVPSKKEPLSKLLKFWTRVGKVDEAIATWNWAHSRSLADASSTGDFFAFLMKAGRASQAQELWHEYTGSQEPIYNPSFEEPFQPSPFDWKIYERQDVDVERVSDMAHSGSWSLRIRFNGESNTAYRQTNQDLVLATGRYRLSAMIKTEQVTTDEGIRVHVVNPDSESKLSVWTGTITGTENWTEVSVPFEVATGAKITRVEFARQASTRFDSKIGGTTWIDDVQLTRQ